MSIITNNSVFGQYQQKENRVTAALLHVINKGGEELINHILDCRHCQLPNSSIVVDTQSSNGHSVPDGKISCGFSFNLYIECKIVDNCFNNTHNISQLSAHRKAIKSSYDKLIYLTSDSQKPSQLNANEIWFSWNEICDIISNFENEDPVFLFLVEQFKLLLVNFGLYDDSARRVIVVGGAFGEDVALKYNFYACQNNRSFRKAKYLTFAHQNRIKYLFEVVYGPQNNIDISQIPNIVNTDYFTNKEPNYVSEFREFFKLKHIHTFDPVIINDNKDKNGNRCAFVQGQTYTEYDKIMNARYTSDL